MNPEPTAEARLLDACRLLADDELLCMLAVTATERDVMVAKGATHRAYVLNAIATACATARDERVALERSTEDAMSPFRVVGETSS